MSFSQQGNASTSGHWWCHRPNSDHLLGRMSPRVIDIINQCRYIASKKGLTTPELIQAMREDERRGKVYSKPATFCPWFLSQNSHGESMTGRNSPPPHSHSYSYATDWLHHHHQHKDMLETRRRHQTFQGPWISEQTSCPIFEEEESENLMDQTQPRLLEDVSSDEGESEKINGHNTACNINNTPPPSLSLLTSLKRKRPCSSLSKTKQILPSTPVPAKATEDLIDENVPGGHADEEFEDMIVETARAKACASYMQIRGKMKDSTGDEDGDNHNLYGRMAELDKQILSMEAVDMDNDDWELCDEEE